MKSHAGGRQAMQTLLQDIFSDTISKVKQLGMWEKLTIEQKEMLVSKYILEHYNRKKSQQKAAANSR
jgi:hypothetical protein